MPVLILHPLKMQCPKIACKPNDIQGSTKSTSSEPRVQPNALPTAKLRANNPMLWENAIDRHPNEEDNLGEGTSCF